MDEKFILAALHDEKSKDIADILANKTARRILDYLSEKEASETDIARDLKLPMSTVSYNIKKLLKNKLIEVKDFFWSEKGNKINIYRVARKLIVIAPKYAHGYNFLKSIIPTVLIAAIFLIALSAVIYYNVTNQTFPGIPGGISESSDLKKFSSLSELKDFLKANTEAANSYGVLGTRDVMMAETSGTGVASIDSGAEAAPKAAEEFSTTNIQVAGVDEADIVKNDGKYIYALSRNKLFIVDAYPAETAGIVSVINISGTASEIFVNDDRLVVFGSEYSYYYPYPVMEDVGVAKAEIAIAPPRYSSPKTFIQIYDIEDRENPELVRNISMRGNYYDSRMIGDYVYSIINLPVRNYDSLVMPAVYSDAGIREVKAQEIYYFDVPDSSYTFSTISAINLEDDDSEITSEVFMMGYTQNMYVSLDNIYLVYQKRLSSEHYYEKLIEDVYLQVVPEDIADKILEVKESDEKYYKKMQEIGEIVQDYVETLDVEERFEFQNDFEEKMQAFQEEIEKERQKTVIHRISVDENKIEHEAEGEVSGNVLNQFSMDEYDGYFRIATTTGSSWFSGEKQSNNVYVLDLDLDIIGKVEDLAEGERIYSARFLGDRAYLVTFRKIDPLFVISLENPERPEVLGKLKIPGYSDYLHPYDENHLIGIGKETQEAEEGDFAWYQGVKISLFDVSDVENPVEIDKYEIGDRGTDSYALHEHKAFLFSRSKNLLVLPIILAKINESRYEGEIPDWAYGDFVWQGAYVFDISLDGIKVKGRITHDENKTAEPERYYYWNSEYAVKRSLYMDTTLYTVSDKMIKMNGLEYLDEINKVELS